MKWAASFEGKPGVVGPVDWGTNEEYDGATVSITGTFIRLREPKKRASSFVRACFWRLPPMPTIPMIKTRDRDGQFCADGGAGKMPDGATDSSYAEHLVLLMDQYDLYRFDE